MADTRSFFLRLSGVVAPVLFVAVFTVFGFFRHDYSAVSMYVSALSLGWLGWIQIVNFMLFGLLSSLFAIHVSALLRQGRASKAGPFLLFLSALCFFLSGPFVMDPLGSSRADASVHGTIHGILGAVAFLLMPITCFVFYSRFRKDQGWPYFKGWTIAAGIVTSCTVVFFSVVSKSLLLARHFNDWLGLIQRSVIVPYMAWLLAFGIAAYGNGHLRNRPQSLGNDQNVMG